MLDPEVKVVLKYGALALLAFALGCATALVPQLMDPSIPPINWRVVIGTGITALVTAYGGSRLPRSGSAAIAAQVNTLKAQGIDKADMIVVTQDEAVHGIAQPVDPGIEREAERLRARFPDAMKKEAP